MVYHQHNGIKHAITAHRTVLRLAKRCGERLRGRGTGPPGGHALPELSPFLSCHRALCDCSASRAKLGAQHTLWKKRAPRLHRN